MLGLPLPPFAVFPLVYTFQFCAYMLGNALLSNCFLFTTLMVSPCLWIADMSECPPVDSRAMTLKGEEACLWGKHCLNFFCQGCRDSICCLHLTSSHQPWTFCRRLCFPHIVSNTHHFTAGLKPSQTARLSEMMANLPGRVLHPQSSEMVTVSGCQLVKFCTSQPGLNSWQSPD